MSDAPTLHLAAVYTREVAASLARIWENVFDWEHLAHLHASSFAKCDLIDRGAWGWRVALVTAGRSEEPQVIEMRANRAAGHYVSTTIEGIGAGTEIGVALAPREGEITCVSVEFHVPEANLDRLAAIGGAYTAAYPSGSSGSSRGSSPHRGCTVSITARSRTRRGRTGRAAFRSGIAFTAPSGSTCPSVI